MTLDEVGGGGGGGGGAGATGAGAGADDPPPPPQAASTQADAERTSSLEGIRMRDILLTYHEASVHRQMLPDHKVSSRLTIQLILCERLDRLAFLRGLTFRDSKQYGIRIFS